MIDFTPTHNRLPRIASAGQPSVAPPPAARRHQADVDDLTQLMLRFQEGDDSAFSEIVQHFKPYLQRWFQREFSDWHLAEDLTQAVFLRVVRARKTYQPTARFKSWLCTIAINVVKNERRSRRHCANVTTLTAPDDLPSSVDSSEPLQIVERKETRRLVRTAAASLPACKQRVLELRYRNGLTYREIGELIGLSPMAVKGRLLRAKLVLKPKLHAFQTESGA